MAKLILDKGQQFNALADLEASLGWQILKQVLEENVQILGEEILDDIDDKIKPEEKKILNLKRHFQKKLVEMPRKLREKLQDLPAGEPVELDPFD